MCQLYKRTQCAAILSIYTDHHNYITGWAFCSKFGWSHCHGKLRVILQSTSNELKSWLLVTVQIVSDRAWSSIVKTIKFSLHVKWTLLAFFFQLHCPALAVTPCYLRDRGFDLVCFELKFSDVCGRCGAFQVVYSMMCIEEPCAVLSYSDYCRYVFFTSFLYLSCCTYFCSGTYISASEFFCRSSQAAS